MTVPGPLLVQWFGPAAWGRALATDEHHQIMRIPAPVGEPCLACDEAIGAEDYGEMVVVMSGTLEAPSARLAPQHRECLILHTSGHLVGLCPCTEYEGLTLRQAALAVVERLRARPWP